MNASGTDDNVTPLMICAIKQDFDAARSLLQAEFEFPILHPYFDMPWLKLFGENPAWRKVAV